MACSDTSAHLLSVEPAGDAASDGALSDTSSACSLGRRSRRRRARSKLPLHLLTPSVQDADDRFFENFCALSFKRENAKRQLMHQNEERVVDPDKERRNSMRALAVRLGQMAKQRQPDVENLYIEVLYTIRHMVGTSAGVQTQSAEDLVRYAQQAFQISAGQHERLEKRVAAEKPPVVLLNVVVIEARSLVAKDANGFSDPYCMLGIVPGKRRGDGSDDEPTSPHADELAEKRRGSIFQRLGGSFRFKTKPKKTDAEPDEAIPAKLIKATSVVRLSLNPKWNEKFTLICEDGQTDRFHLDIWDHDDEGSVVDAVARLNEVASLKGLGRYFKQVAQNARTDIKDSTVDDFLGCVTMRLKEVPSTGFDGWLPLDGRSPRSTVCGELHLKMWLGTREERADQDEDDNLVDVNEHVFIMRVFAENAIRLQAPNAWDGKLPPAALTVLHQHAVQGDLTDVQIAMCYWLAYCGVHLDVELNYALLLPLLADLLSLWAPTALNKDEEDMLAESFSNFLNHCYDQVVLHRQTFPASDVDAVARLKALIGCLVRLHRSELFKKALPFQRELTGELTYLLKKSATEYYERSKRSIRKKAADDEMESCVFARLLSAVDAACANGRQVYHNVFAGAAHVDYFELTYDEFDRLIDADVACVLMDSTGAAGRSVASELTVDLAHASQDNLLPVFEFYLAVNDFINYKESLSKTDVAKCRVTDCSQHFEKAFITWIGLAKKNVMKRIDVACQLDKNVETSAAEVLQSSSYVDVCFTLQQMVEFWQRLNIGDVSRNAALSERLVQEVCKAAEYYADKLFALLAHGGFYETTATSTKDSTVRQMCTTVNDAEQARRVVTSLADKLHLDELANQLGAECGHGSCVKWRSSVEHLIDSCDACISSQVEMAMRRLVERRAAALKKHVFHLAWSPHGCQLDSAVKPLVEQLDADLIRLHRSLLHRNFVRLLAAQLDATLSQLRTAVEDNPGMEPEFYRRLYDAVGVLADFFHAGGKGLTLDAVEKIPIYQEVTQMLSLNQTPSVDLIERYYADLLKQQQETSECKFGIVNVRAYYNSQAHSLVVDVIGAKHVIPLDTNGLSDPFVIVELVPTFYFRQCPVLKTRVASKTLNPVFDETFEFSVRPDVAACAMLHFIVMDHDMLVSNDFAGEAFLDLADVPGLRAESSPPSALRQFNLILLHPSEYDTALLQVLASRKEDKEAQEFTRHIDTVKNS